MNIRYAALLSALFSILVLCARNASKWMDRFVQVMGCLMILLTAYVAIVSKPPLMEALYRSVWPEKIDWKTIITIVGGTVGGYICFAGAHRLLDAKLPEKDKLKKVSRSAMNGILTASAMRILLFLAVLGVVSRGLSLDPSNPAADVFRKAAGETGYRLFGIIMWSAAITSVIGSAYTSISFIRSYSPWMERNQRMLLIVFISISTLIFLLHGQPVRLLLFAGLINGFILPFSLVILLLAVYTKRPKTSYQHPKWLGLSGILIALVLAFIALQAILQ